jgi:hypothetical protein
MAMLVFIDESGDAGFKIARGSSALFGVGMIIFADGNCARETQSAIAALHSRLRPGPEFKFSKCSYAVRDGYFRGVAKLPFAVRALVVDKQAIYSQSLRGSADMFYNYFVRQLMAYDGGTLATARVRIDGSGDREFKRELCAYLRRSLGERIKDVKMSDSRRDPLTQLADMYIGAIVRAERTDRADARRWREILEPRIHIKQLNVQFDVQKTILPYAQVADMSLAADAIN